MNNQTIYWLWIQNILGYASSRITPLMNSFTFAEDFYRADLEEKLSCGCFNETHSRKLENTSLDSCARIMEYCKKNHIEIITPGDAVYPSRFKTIKAPPAVLFVKGNIDCLSSQMCIAVIGTRQATPAGCTAALSVTKELCQNNTVIISGGAKGIDTAAHKAAIGGNGQTVCVLGHGHARCDYHKISELILSSERHGAVVSEYVPFESPSRNTYPLRDRLISGLSDGVVVIESGVTGGTMITVKAAKSQNRDLFAYRFPDKSNISDGTAMLISKGITPVSSGNDVIGYYKNSTRVNNEGDPQTVFIKAKESYFKSLNKSINRGYSVDVGFGEKPRKTETEMTEDFFSSHPNANREYITAGRHLTSSLFDGEYDTEKTKNTNYNRKEKNTKKLSDIPFTENTIDSPDKNEAFVLPEDLSDEAIRVYECLGKSPVSVDKLVELTGLNIKRVNSALTELELEEIITGIEGRRYLRNH